MSGVFGVLDSRRQTDIQSLVDRIGNASCYRDWQIVENYCNQAAGLGFGRVGIGVFNQAAQPVWNDGVIDDRVPLLVIDGRPLHLPI